MIISIQPPLTPQMSVTLHEDSLGRSGHSTRCTLLLLVLRVPYTQYGAVHVRKKKMKFLTKGGIRCIFRSSLGTFILLAGTH